MTNTIWPKSFGRGAGPIGAKGPVGVAGVTAKGANGPTGPLGGWGPPGLGSNLGTISGTVTEFQKRVLWAIHLGALTIAENGQEYLGDRDVSPQIMLLNRRSLIMKDLGTKAWTVTVFGMKYL